MKQLMDWLPNPHSTPDTGMPTYLLLSNGPRANGDHFCLVQHCFEEFTSHQLDLRRPTVHANFALKSERSSRVTPGHLSSGAYYLESSKPTYLLYFHLTKGAPASHVRFVRFLRARFACTVGLLKSS